MLTQKPICASSVKCLAKSSKLDSPYFLIPYSTPKAVKIVKAIERIFVRLLSLLIIIFVVWRWLNREELLFPFYILVELTMKLDTTL